MGHAYVNQHIVSQGYLSRFGQRDGNKIIIGTLFKKGKTIFPQSIENVGYIKKFYDVTNKSDPKHWEFYLAKKIDSLCGKIMDSIIAKIIYSKNNFTVLTSYDKEVLAKVIVTQLFRVPYTVDYIKNEIYYKVSTKVKNEIVRCFPEEVIKKYEKIIKEFELTEEEKKNIIFEKLFDSELFQQCCDILKNNIWVCYYNALRSNIPFVTSDNPVLVEGLGKRSIGLFNNGLICPETCIFFPLSPSIAIAIYSKEGIIGLAENLLDRKKIILDETKFIIDKNIKIIDQAYNHSFIPQPLFDICKNEINKDYKKENKNVDL